MRVLTHPVLPRLVALIRPRLLHLAVELDLLFVADLRQWDVANIEHPVSLRRKYSCEKWSSGGGRAYLFLCKTMIDNVEETLVLHCCAHFGGELGFPFGCSELDKVNDGQVSIIN